MFRLEAKFNVVTPLFLGGARHAFDSIRVPSIVGALRFWWRALNYSHFNGDIAALHRREGELFGSTCQQSSILFKVKDVVCTPNTAHAVGAVHPQLKGCAGARYLAYGVSSFRGELAKGCVDSASFTMQLCSRKAIDPSIISAIKLFGMLGGLGSKARKGYGSVSLVELSTSEEKGWIKHQVASNQSSYEQQLSGLIDKATTYGIKPKISAFSSQSSVWILSEDKSNSAMPLLDRYGKAMQRYRSWGMKGKQGVHSVNGEASEKRFKEDHDWFKGEDVGVNFHPRRVIFGLPHNYYSQGMSKQVQPENFERRASPLFHHIQQLGNDFYSIVFVLKSEFLPLGERINAGNNTVPQKIEYQLFDEFMNAQKKSDNEDYFPKKKLIFPTKPAHIGQL